MSTLEHNVFAASTPSKPKLSCELCNKKGFFCQILDNFKKCTCPLCGKVNSNPSDDIIFCDDCLIIYTFGCVHAQQGSNTDIHYATLISSFKYDGKTYDKSMPLFDDFKDFNDHKHKYIWNWMCQCSGNTCMDCPNASYPHKDHKCSCKGTHVLQSSDDDLFK